MFLWSNGKAPVFETGRCRFESYGEYKTLEHDK